MNMQTKIKVHRLAELQNLLPVSKKADLFNYEKFLRLLQIYPTLKAVPTKAIDNIWHQHLNNSELYNRDCKILFGKRLFHKESLGKSEKDKLKKNYSLTNKLWLKEYLTTMGNLKNMALCGVGDDGDSGNDE